MRKREMMAKDSSVRAPELYNPKAMLAAIREEECDASGQDRHVESEDRCGAQVRDLEKTLLEVIDSAEESACGGMASKGTEGDEHWIIESMDGAGLTHVASGVRVVVLRHAAAAAAARTRTSAASLGWPGSPPEGHPGTCPCRPCRRRG